MRRKFRPILRPILRPDFHPSHKNLPNTSLGGPFLGFKKVKKQRERRKTKAEKGKDKKEEETLKHEKPPPFRWGCFLAIF